ncbi:glutamate-1-semialdehyde-2,1-aminomutase [mine drainage metagenome]|uniref:glutamate-1-semialdehyde 2,1-aminomutase n=2 Tax=mine drainage metagenome TaxID=410659 RepID=T1BZT6_9ZZZZ
MFITGGQGAELIAADGRHFIDYICSWGALIAGHAHPSVVAAVSRAAASGLSFGAPTPSETELARVLVARVPHVERVRLTSSGTEATMSAIRLARAVTGRDLIVKFDGAYHGHSDGLLVQAGSGALTIGHPSSPGVPAAVAQLTRTLPFNDVQALEVLFAREGSNVAAVLVEIVAGNMGLILPEPAFLDRLTHLTRDSGALLIADEVMTGFRVGPQGAQGRYGVHADLVTLGKIIGGGLPIGALGGAASHLDRLAPDGPVYQAGTLSGNPLSVAGGLATLQLLADPGVYRRLEMLTDRLAEGLLKQARRAGIGITVPHVPGMWCIFFSPEPVRNLVAAQRTRRGDFARFFHSLKDQGILLPPSPFESAFISLAHEDHHIDATLAAAEIAFRTLAD